MNRELLRQYVRQRLELGQREWVLDTFAAEEVLALLRAGRGGTSRARTKTETETKIKTETNTGTGVNTTTATNPNANTSPDRRAEAHPKPAPATDRSPLLALLRDEVCACTKCRLSETRTHAVFGEGAADADVVVVGEAPGGEEDRTGRPFVGPAGRLLDLLLATAGFPRERVFICNVLKCRPPKNRDPQPDEVASCSAYLRRQIELIEPKVLLALGRFAAQYLLSTDEAMGKLRGSVRPYRGVPVVATYHPAFLLRSPQWVRAAWDDFQLLRHVYDQQSG